MIYCRAFTALNDFIVDEMSFQTKGVGAPDEERQPGQKREANSLASSCHRALEPEQFLKQAGKILL